MRGLLQGKGSVRTVSPSEMAGPPEMEGQANRIGMLEMTGLIEVGHRWGTGPLGMKGTLPGMKGTLPGMKGTPKAGAAAAGAPVQRGILLSGAKPVDLVEKLPQLWPVTPHLLQQPVSNLPPALAPVSLSLHAHQASCTLLQLAWLQHCNRCTRKGCQALAGCAALNKMARDMLQLSLHDNMTAAVVVTCAHSIQQSNHITINFMSLRGHSVCMAAGSAIDALF